MTIKVKPLEWHGPDVNGEYDAQSLLGIYSIDTSLWLSIVGGHHASLGAAKAAAQADYERRILSALDSTPTPVIEITDEMVERAQRIYSDTQVDLVMDERFDDVPLDIHDNLAMRAVLEAVLNNKA